MTIGAGAIGEFAIGDSGRATYAEAGGGGTGATAAQIWAYQPSPSLFPGVTAGQMLTALYQAHLAGTLKVDVRYVNGIQIKGVGTESDPWNPV